jgi:hypothetical protein
LAADASGELKSPLPRSFLRFQSAWVTWYEEIITEKGGNASTITYNQVCSGTTGFAEIVKVEYATEKDFEDLTDFFYR